VEPIVPPGAAGTLLAAAQWSDWSVPVNLGPVVNSPFAENLPEMSRDGLSLYFTSNRPGGSGLGDIWVAQRASVDDPWGTPVNLGPTVNSSVPDLAPALSPDGHYLFFTSSRPGGFGLNDIWVSWRANVKDDFAWEAPVNAGPPVNGPQFEAGPAFRRPEFYFTRGPGGTAFDIYVSSIIGNTFEEPRVVVELNSSANDLRPTLRFDRREIFLSSNRPGGLGLDDIWGSTRQSAADPWGVPVNLGAVINSAFDDNQPGLSEDGRTLFFTSNRPGGSGGLDLYVSTRSVIPHE
jgi:Tol biopolymer transport system component